LAFHQLIIGAMVREDGTTQCHLVPRGAKRRRDAPAADGGECGGGRITWPGLSTWATDEYRYLVPVAQGN
jgi:hypothetical protein